LRHAAVSYSPSAILFLQVVLCAFASLRDAGCE
jgi:hypothetical protein